MSTELEAFKAGFIDRLAQDLRAMSDEDFGRYLQGAVATLEACQKEFERRATKGQPAGVA